MWMCIRVLFVAWLAWRTLRTLGPGLLDAARALASPRKRFPATRQESVDALRAMMVAAAERQRKASAGLRCGPRFDRVPRVR